MYHTNQTSQASLEAVRETLTGASLQIHWWSPLKGLENDEKETAAASLEASREFLLGRKKILDDSHPRWKAVVNVRTRLRQYWDFATMPYCMQGVRMVLRAKKSEIFAKIEEFQAELSEASRQLDEVRYELIDTARRQLGRMFRAEYYPDTFQGKFTLEARERSIEPPSYLMHTNAEEYRRELERSLSDIQQGLAKFEQDCWRQLAGLAEKLHLAMTGRLQGSSLENFAGLFDRVAFMNFEGSEAFKQALGKAQDILEDVSVDDLRKSSGLKGRIKADIESLVEEFGQLRSRVELANPEVQEVVV